MLQGADVESPAGEQLGPILVQYRLRGGERDGQLNHVATSHSESFGRLPDPLPDSYVSAFGAMICGAVRTRRPQEHWPAMSMTFHPPSS